MFGNEDESIPMRIRKPVFEVVFRYRGFAILAAGVIPVNVNP
ncbi:hypothetical protein [Desulfoluna sp.]|nr:hypothetical protein [Desulfoluna sp.]